MGDSYRRGGTAADRLSGERLDGRGVHPQRLRDVLPARGEILEVHALRLTHDWLASITLSLVQSESRDLGVVRMSDDPAGSIGQQRQVDDHLLVVNVDDGVER